MIPLTSADLPNDVLKYVQRARADNTARTYRSQWRAFEVWCRQRGVTALPAEPMTVATYLAQRAQAGAAVAALSVTLAALRFKHRTAALPFALNDPTLALVLDGIRREHVGEQRQAEPLTGYLLREVLQGGDGSIEFLRSAALLAILYVFALRPAEAATLDWHMLGGGPGWLTIAPDAAEIVLLGSKASPRRMERVVVPTDANPLAMAAIERWVAAIGIAAGEPLLRAVRCNGAVGRSRLHAGNVSAIVKRAMTRHLERSGLTPDAARLRARGFSGHSGRLGMYITTVEAGVPPQHIAALARHKGMAMVRRYAARADMLKCASHHTHGVGV